MPFHFRSSKKELGQSIFLNLVFAAAEAVVGLFANSTALLSDAIHDMTDSVSLGLSWLAQKMATRKPTKQFSFGFFRLSVLAAFINGIVLIGITMLIFKRAYERILHPEPVSGWLVFGIAVIGIIVNGIVVKRLAKHREDVNTRSAFWHMLEDFFGWIAVLVGGVILVITGWTLIDPIISIIIGLLVVYGAIDVLKESILILAEGKPKDIDLDAVIKTIRSVKHVKQVHDVHVWTLGAGVKTLSCHIQLTDMTVHEARFVIDTIEKMLHDKYHIQHATIEVETLKEACPPGKKCN